MTAGHQRVDVLGVRVSAVNQASAVETIASWLEAGAREYVCVTGMHGVMESVRDAELREIHNRSGLTTPDGMSVVWAGKLAGASWIERVYGPDLMLELAALAASKGWKSYFYGGQPGVPESLGHVLGERFPGFQVAGSLSPPFRPLNAEEDAAVIDQINSARPDIVWVGLSTPKQERWMASHRSRLNAPVLIGVGAAFDIHTGRLSQAPRWMQRSGLEWSYRLLQEPQRLWRRYLLNIPEFLARLMLRPPRLV